jgi:hypothetical protein
MSATIDQVAAGLGVSIRGVRLRRDALGGVIDEHIRRGDHNELLFGDGAFAILRRVEDVRRGESISLRQAVERVRGELQGNGEHASRQPESTGAATSSDTSMMQVMLDDLRRDRDAWRDLALRLQDQLALPAPRAARPRRRWWAPWNRSGQ